MWLYLIIFSIPLFAYLKGGPINKDRLFLLGYILFLALFVGLSDMFGGSDRYIYGEVFDGIADAITLGKNPFQDEGFLYFEKGYSILSLLIALITENRYIFIFIITSIIYYNIYKVFERHFTNYPLAFIIFLGMIFFFTFTYLRQVLSYTIAWLSIQALIDKDWKKFSLLIVITAFMHKSGIIFAILWFIPIKKWKSRQVILVLFACAAIGLTGIVSSLYDAVMESGLMASQGNDYNAEGGARIAYVVEVAFFAWIILRNYDRIEANRQNLLFLNMAWAFCGFLLLFIRSSDGGRVAWFFTIGIVYIMTLIATTKKNSVNVFARNHVPLLLILVMLTLYIRVFNAWQQMNNLYPYKTFLTDGHRTPDYSFENYEYDAAYDGDKFYRPAIRIFKKKNLDYSNKFINNDGKAEKFEF